MSCMAEDSLKSFMKEFGKQATGDVTLSSMSSSDVLAKIKEVSTA